MSSSASPFLNQFTNPTFPGEIYLDHAAATPVRKACLEAMWPYFSGTFANPANRLHPAGERAQNALEAARHQMAEIFQTPDEGVVFTASATEANNLLIKGLWNHPLRKRNKILYAATEHSCVAATCMAIRYR
jgi:cysteine desulfurase